MIVDNDLSVAILFILRLINGTWLRVFKHMYCSLCTSHILCFSAIKHFTTFLDDNIVASQPLSIYYICGNIVVICIYNTHPLCMKIGIRLPILEKVILKTMHSFYLVEYNNWFLQIFFNEKWKSFNILLCNLCHFPLQQPHLRIFLTDNVLTSTG